MNFNPIRKVSHTLRQEKKKYYLKNLKFSRKDPKKILYEIRIYKKSRCFFPQDLIFVFLKKITFYSFDD